MAGISMRCKECGGTLEVDKGKEVLFCPYCGSKGLIEESDEVKIKRIEQESFERMANAFFAAQRQERKNDNKVALIIIGALLLFALVMTLFGCLGVL